MGDPDSGPPEPSDSGAPLAGRRFPRVPGYAWAWFQRSRPVVSEAARRLTGTEPAPGFVDELRSAFEADAFTRDVVIGVVADVAFAGRAPARRPPGASWDRGLTWWAAALAGTSPREFEARSEVRGGRQEPLFDPPGGSGPAGRSELSASGLQQHARDRAGRRAHPSPERAALADALRSLLETAQGDQVPAAAIRQLLEHLDAPPSA